MSGAPKRLEQRLAAAERLWLFLDYDGTLADFAPTPEHVTPNPEVVELLTGLAAHPRLRVAVISGRRLSHIRSLLPVPGVLLAGTYGIELLTTQGERIERAAYPAIRRTLETLRPGWEALIAGRRGFYLEDKGWALALHARFADENETEEVLAAAQRAASEMAASGSWRLLGGHKFLEIAPREAHKGHTVAYLLDHYPWPGALPLYLGDDDKDEEAFGVVKVRGGIAILVASKPRETRADGRLETPQSVRRWLAELPSHLDLGTRPPAVYPNC
jgi:trehalose 6-phosphate phosphatase